MTAIDLKSRVREVQDFPEPGIGFKDIAPLLLDPEALKQTVGDLAAWTAEREPDLVLGAEARGFWLGAAIAVEVGCGFVPARRPGKLPPETVSARYALEYGENALEVAADAIAQGARVVIHDDVLATGGTVAGDRRPRRAARRPRGRDQLRDRAVVPRGPQAARRVRHLLADRVLRRA